MVAAHQSVSVATDGTNLWLLPKSKDKRLRGRFQFLLDARSDSDYAIGSHLEGLKAARKMTTWLRDACRLLMDLQQGNTSVLFELFPHLRHQLAAAPAALAPAPVGQGGNSPSRLPEHESRRQNEELPIDETLEVKQAAPDLDNNAGWNFMIAAARQVYGNYHGLPADIIEYGIRTKRIPPDALKPKISQKKQSKKSAGGNPKAMKVQPIAAPSFDDLEEIGIS